MLWITGWWYQYTTTYCSWFDYCDKVTSRMDLAMVLNPTAPLQGVPQPLTTWLAEGNCLEAHLAKNETTCAHLDPTLQRKRCSHCISKFRIAQTCTNYVYTATEETEKGIHRARQRERTITHPASRDENRWQCQNACANNQIENIAASSQRPPTPSPSSQCTLLSTKPSMVISFCSFLLDHILYSYTKYRASDFHGREIDSFHLHTCKRPWANTETRDYFLPCLLQLSPKPFRNPKKIPFGLSLLWCYIITSIRPPRDSSRKHSLTQRLMEKKKVKEK
jgi:hypothetical protein